MPTVTTAPAGRSAVPTHRLLKVCGATRADEVELLAAAGADLVGLWWSVPDGPADLTTEQVVALAATARATGRLEPVLVTFSADADATAALLRRSGIRWVQLHAYQPPGMVRALRAGTGADITIVKVLHVREGTCVEQRFVASYARAGTDLFLLDTATSDGRVGSTGQRIDPAIVTALASTFEQPFLLAGGLTAANAGEYATVTASSRLIGIDVDSAARDADGRFQFALVSGLAHHWRAGSTRRDR